MRRVARLFVCAAIATAGLTVLGCEPPPASPPPPPTQTTPTRPPQPVMASPAWGERVALDLGKDVVAPAGVAPAVLVQQAQAKLMSLEPGSERAAIPLLVQAWKGATDDQTRGLALALVAVAMVWDPTVEGYVERLTDAFGLGLYAGTIDTSATIGQAARSIVLGAGGSVRQARDLIDLLATMPRQPDDLWPWLALARASANDRRQAFFDEAERGLKTLPSSWRLRATLADRFADLGLYDRAVATIVDDGAPAAARLVKARAQVQAGLAQEALPVLLDLSTSLVGVDEPRRSEALYWLAEARLLTGDVAGARTTATSLEARPGWRREAALLAASFALQDGRLDDAKGLLMPLVAGTPTSTVQVERRIARLALDVVAEVKDAAAFERVERFLQVVDVDSEAIAAARARMARDAASAARTGPEILAGVTSMPVPARELLAARRAIASQAGGLAAPIVERLAKAPGARAARALRVGLLEEPRAKADAAVAALAGAGPPLLESDLLPVIDALGAAPTAQGEKLLAGLEQDARPAVKRAVQRAREDLRDPAGRARRLKEEAGDHADHGGHDDHGGGRREPRP
jgi:hypothetical protein